MRWKTVGLVSALGLLLGFDLALALYDGSDRWRPMLGYGAVGAVIGLAASAAWQRFRR